ncbi:MAG: L-threonylcarbamoyladenylate synthase [Candidatus Krumholzibacteriia bacterium]|nr:L-threonylcarbamoyladenylate synthase [bacterium]MCB9513174.1 L-threonylcarbamoyladenylate synthase [Candidatus Latescibacterota bacterium]MCB9514638.1 L-threonylcarbamoyladenylate synthase [Candidatus Latescibacterota bacterium]
MKDHSISVHERRALLEATRALVMGHVAVLPTDTLYGLHGLATSPGIVDKIARLKGYESPGRPFILLAPDTACIERYAELDAEQRGHVDANRDRPITFIFKALPATPRAWTSLGEDDAPRVAFRLPETPFLKELLGCLEAPLLSTSVNRAGEPPLESAEEIVKLFGDNVDLVVADSELELRVAEEGALPSTLVDLTCRPPKVLREGRTPFVLTMGAT